jgi:hypothetical protein
MTALVLGATVAAVGYCISLYIWPFKPHGRCHGTGRNAGSNGRRFGVCKSRRCNGGTVQRFGSRAVHRAVRAGRSSWRS